MRGWATAKASNCSFNRISRSSMFAKTKDTLVVSLSFLMIRSRTCSIGVIPVPANNYEWVCNRLCTCNHSNFFKFVCKVFKLLDRTFHFESISYFKRVNMGRHGSIWNMIEIRNRLFNDIDEKKWVDLFVWIKETFKKGGKKCSTYLDTF